MRPALAAISAAALALGAAAAQTADPTTDYYAAVLYGEDGDYETGLLALTLFEDGYAWGRLQLPERGDVLVGAGTLTDGTDLNMAFRSPGVHEDLWWGPERGAELRAEDVAARLNAARDHDWAAEGRWLSGELAFTWGERTSFEASRLAAAQRWSFSLGRVSTSAELPRFPGYGELNSWLEDSVLQEALGFAQEGVALDDEGQLGWSWYRDERVELAGAAERFLSLLSTVDTYTGGAHPNRWFGSYLVEVDRDGIVLLDLSDVLSGRGWLDALSSYVLADLAEQEAMWVVEGEVGSLDAEDLAVFTLDAAGVTFHFAPYAMGPYAQGSFHVTVPYDFVAPYAREGGPLHVFAAGAHVELPLP